MADRIPLNLAELKQKILEELKSKPESRGVFQLDINITEEDNTLTITMTGKTNIYYHKQRAQQNLLSISYDILPPCTIIEVKNEIKILGVGA